MIKNYLLIGLRNLRKHLGYSTINIAGLGLGLATCLLLYIWINQELSYDKFHTHANRLYRGSLEYGFGGQVAKTSVSPTALLPALLNLPEVENGVRIANPAAWRSFIVKRDENLFTEDHFYFADSAFFDLFSYPLIAGNPATALTQPYSLVLAESVAKKYFGNEDPMGKSLLINGTQAYQVTGVMRDMPANSFLQSGIVASFNSLSASREAPQWWSANYQTFVLLNPGASVTTVKTKIDDLVKKELASELTNPGDYVTYNFSALTDLHLYSEYDGEFEVVGDIQYVLLFSGIALLVLVIAVTNYINLATARAAERAKEVSLRKVIGADRKQLFVQFIGESIIITAFSFMTGLILAQVLLPVFNTITGSHFEINTFINPAFIIGSLLAMLAIALLAGSYPAFVITSFNPSRVLKGNFKFSSRGIWLRQSLVVFQFTVSIILIVGTLVILKQLNFIQDRKLGYAKDNTLVMPLDANTAAVYEALRTELIRQGAAASVARGNESPVNVRGGYGMNIPGGSERGIIGAGLPIDENYLPTLGIALTDGRNFTRADLERADRDTVYSFIVNEAALHALQLSQDKAVGTRLGVSGRRGEIVGVIEDFHFASLHQAIGPMVLFPESFQLNLMFVRLPEGDVNEHLASVKKVYSSIVTHRPFEYEFMDQQYANLYQGEQRMGIVFSVFATLAIIIACLGLLGLVSFSAAQKTKEIGIRKVLGATAGSIMVLITRDYSRLILISVALASPLAWWIMTRWLDDFAYKTEIGVGPLVLAAGICLLIALIAASQQVIKAALVNPSQTLRNE